MTVFRSGEAPPHWCELTAFYIHDLGIDETVACSPETGRERLLVTNGTCQIQVRRWLPSAQGSAVPGCSRGYSLRGRRKVRRRPGGSADRPLEERAGRLWRVPRPKQSRLDQQGRPGLPIRNRPRSTRTTTIATSTGSCSKAPAKPSSARSHFPMRRGDCLAIGMGHHHDFPNAAEPIKAVYFETTLEGEKRVGHLWAAHPWPSPPETGENINDEKTDSCRRRHLRPPLVLGIPGRQHRGQDDRGRRARRRR